MKIGYAYWGFLADDKFDKNGRPISTPDGNAFYSWSIINSLLEAGHKVYQMMPNRDKPIESFKDRRLCHNFLGMGFDYSESENPRYKAYVGMHKDMYNNIEDWVNVREEHLYKIWDNNKLYNLDAILLEWRMEIPGRNTQEARFNSKEWQPDLFIQTCIIKYCITRRIKLIIFDLDYKLTYEQAYELDRRGVDYFIIELGHKWQTIYNDINAMHVEIPFDFRYINNYEIQYTEECSENLVYVGNRYERDWCIDKYIPTEMHGVNIYGNWLEGGRDSKERWPSINFHRRITVTSMMDAYAYSSCTILLAKQEYCTYGFMTARVIESIYYGTLPLFIEEFDDDIIGIYAGQFKDELTVHNKQEVIDKVMYYKYHQGERIAIIKYLREHLSFMDSSIFANTLEEVIRV